jgi:hypothetical protein
MALPVNVGDSITFQHFGTVRPGRVVRITPTVVVVEWTAPSSGITRQVRVRRVPWPGYDESRPTQLEERLHFINCTQVCTCAGRCQIKGEG